MQILETNWLDDDMTIAEFYEIKSETEKSVLVDFGDVEHWIPKSVCEYGLDKDTNIPIIAIKDWKYKQLNL